MHAKPTVCTAPYCTVTVSICCLPLITHPATWQTDGEERKSQVRPSSVSYVVNLPIETRQVSLPAGRRRLARTSGVPAAACQSLLQGRARSAAYARILVHVKAASYFPRESPGRMLAAGLASSRESESRALWLSIHQPAFFPPRSDDAPVACFFPPLSASGPSVSFGTQRASPVNARMPACQSDGADLSPANLSCPEV